MRATSTALHLEDIVEIFKTLSTWQETERLAIPFQRTTETTISGIRIIISIRNVSRHRLVLFWLIRIQRECRNFCCNNMFYCGQSRFWCNSIYCFNLQYNVMISSYYGFTTYAKHSRGYRVFAKVLYSRGLMETMNAGVSECFRTHTFLLFFFFLFRDPRFAKMLVYALLVYVSGNLLWSDIVLPKSRVWIWEPPSFTQYPWRFQSISRNCRKVEKHRIKLLNILFSLRLDASCWKRLCLFEKWQTILHPIWTPTHPQKLW